MKSEYIDYIKSLDDWKLLILYEYSILKPREDMLTLCQMMKDCTVEEIRAEITIELFRRKVFGL